MKITKREVTTAAVLLSVAIALVSAKLIIESDKATYCDYFQETAGNFHDRREDKRWIKDTMYIIDTTTDIDQEAKDLSKLLVIFATKVPDRETVKRTAKSLCPALLRYRKDIFPQ